MWVCLAVAAALIATTLYMTPEPIMVAATAAGMALAERVFTSCVQFCVCLTELPLPDAALLAAALAAVAGPCARLSAHVAASCASLRPVLWYLVEVGAAVVPVGVGVDMQAGSSVLIMDVARTGAVSFVCLICLLYVGGRHAGNGIQTPPPATDPVLEVVAPAPTVAPTAAPTAPPADGHAATGADVALGAAAITPAANAPIVDAPAVSFTCGRSHVDLAFLATLACTAYFPPYWH